VSGIGVRCEHASLELDGRRILSQITLDLPPGSHCLLLGANGAGKTELMKLLGGERWPTPAARTRRAYRDARGRSLELPQLLPRIAQVGGERQDKYLRHDWNFSVERVVATGAHGGDRPLVALAAAARRRVRHVLARLQLLRLRRRKFLTLSYGERRLTLLARALAGRPRLVLLDEPYNGLDRRCRQLLDRELARLARTRVTIVLSAHRSRTRRGFAARSWSRAGVVHDGALARAPRRWLHPAAGGGGRRRGATTRGGGATRDRRRSWSSATSTSSATTGR
jgi:ABC-type molybdenum transport system ATPase subunit/photorepair protein PhrA